MVRARIQVKSGVLNADFLSRQSMPFFKNWLNAIILSAVDIYNLEYFLLKISGEIDLRIKKRIGDSFLD